MMLIWLETIKSTSHDDKYAWWLTKNESEFTPLVNVQGTCDADGVVGGMRNMVTIVTINEQYKPYL